MKRVCVKKEIQEKRLKIGKNLIKVGMVADCCKKVAATNGELDHEKHDTLGNTWNVCKIKTITIENENESKEIESLPKSFVTEGKGSNMKLEKPFNLIDSLPSHSIMDSHCHIDFILDLRLPKLNLCSWTRLVQRYPALHHRALKGYIQNFCNPSR